MDVEQAKVNNSCTDFAIGRQQRMKGATSIQGGEQGNTVKGAAEKPAYIVEIETRYKSGLKLENMESSVSLMEDTAEDALKRFRQNYLESMAKHSAAAPDHLDTYDLKCNLISGANSFTLNFLTVRRILEGGIASAQKDAFFKRYEKYCNVEENIAKGGKEAFLGYNLMFAGIAACANDDMTTEQYLKIFIKKGLYTQAEYDKVKSFADELQDKSGVFVSAEFQWDDASGDDIRYSYMGALCQIGVDKLSFMEQHRDADEIWVKVAKGSYQNEGEIIQALRDGGYEDAAVDYLKETNLTEEQLSHKAFEQQNGDLWDITVGYTQSGRIDEEAFKNLQNQYFGSENVKVTYSAEQLEKAYKEGKVEKKNLMCTPLLSIDASEDDAEYDSGKNRLENIRKQIKDLNQQIREIKDTTLPEERKSEMVEKFEQQIQILQLQINDVLENMKDEGRK